MIERLARTAALLFALHGLAAAQYVPVPIVLEGETPTGLTAPIDGVGRPGVNASGELTVMGQDTDTLLDDFLWVSSGIFLHSGDSLNGSPGVLDNIHAFDSTRPMNESGSVAWTGDLDGVPFSIDQILAVDSSVILSEGTVSPIAPRTFEGFSFVSIDDGGNVYFEANLDGPTSDDEVLMVHTVTGTDPLHLNATSVFREGATIDGGALDGHTWDNGAFIDLRVNGSGTILVEGDLETTGGGIATSLDNEVLIRKQPGQDYELLLREGFSTLNTPLTGSAPFRSITEIALADNGDWAVRGFLSDAVTTLAFDDVVIADLGGTGPVVILQEGMDLSGPTGLLGAQLGAIQGISVNSSQQALFLANVESSSGSLPIDEALFLYDAGSISLVLADELTAVPSLGPGVMITEIATDNAALAENGTIYFEGEVVIGGFAREGIFEASLPPVFPIDGLACQQTPGLSSVTATWSNPSATPYDGIRVFIDGALLTILPGGENSFETPPSSIVNTVIEVAIEPFIGGDLAAATECATFLVNPRDVVVCSAPAATLSDFSTTLDTVNVPNNITIREVTLSVDIAHTAPGDLDLEVTSPSGTTVVLSTDNGGTDDDLDLTFADFGLPIATADLNAGLFVQPEGPGAMADFRCEDSGGDWIIEVADDGAGDQGTLIEWCLNFIEEPVPALNCCPLPTLLQGSNGGPCTSGAVQLEWLNNGSYSGLEIVRDDGANSITTISLAASATSWLDATALDGQTYEYSLRAQCAAGGSWWSTGTTTVTVDASVVPPVADFVATSDFCAGNVTLTWQFAGIVYTSVTLLREGLFLANVTGTTTFVDTTPAAGTVEYTIVASCFGGNATTSHTVEHQLLPPTDLACASDPALCDGVVTLAWTNPAPYQTLELRVDGVAPAVGITPGDTDYVTAPLASGPHTFEWIATCGTAQVVASCNTTVHLPPAGETDCILALEGVRSGGNHGAVDSANALATALDEIGVSVYLAAPPAGGDFVSGLPCAVDLASFERIWVVTGTFPNDYRLSAAEGDLLASLNRDAEIPLYFEAGDHWGFQHVASEFDARDGVEPIQPATLVDDGDDTFTAMTALDAGNGLDLAGVFPTQIAYAQDNPLGSDYTDRLSLFGETPGAPLDIEVNSSGALWRNAPDGLPDMNDPDESTPYTTAAYTVPLVGGPVIVQTWEFGGFSLDPLDPSASAPERTQLATLYLIALGGPGSPDALWFRGDANDDGAANIADAIYLLNALFPAGGFVSVITCLDAADINDDEQVDIADAIALLDSLFTPNAPPLPPPNTLDGCGLDGGSTLGCDQFTHCP